MHDSLIVAGRLFARLLWEVLSPSHWQTIPWKVLVFLLFFFANHVVRLEGVCRTRHKIQIIQ